jgi:hypothetical protein
MAFTPAPPIPENTSQQLNELRTTRNNYQMALTADSLNPQANYSFDGQSVDRDGWRMQTLARIKEINELISLIDPFEINTVQQ